MKSARSRTPSAVIYELNWLLVTTVVFAIFIPLTSNFLGWDEKEILEQRQWILYWYYSICIVIAGTAFIRYGIDRLARDRYQILLLLALLSFFGSVLLGLLIGAKPSPMIAMAPFFTLLIFHVFPRSVVDNNLVLTKWVLIVFLLAPLAVWFSPNLFELPFDLYTLNSFRGFSSSRTDYGYLLGIAILLLLVQPTRGRWAVLPAMFLALVLSENRAAFFAVAISMAYLASVFGSRRSAVLAGTFLVFGAFCVAVYSGMGHFETRGISFFADSGDRLEIFAASLKQALEKNVWFGAGVFYQNVGVNSIAKILEPHNSILQSILNFGVIPTLLWYAIVAKAYFKCRAAGRAFFLYWLIFGLFHPGYDAFLFTPETFIALLLAVHFGLQGTRSIALSKSRSSSNRYKTSAHDAVRGSAGATTGEAH